MISGRICVIIRLKLVLTTSNYPTIIFFCGRIIDNIKEKNTRELKCGPLLQPNK